MSEQKVPEGVEAIAKQAWDSCHRIAMQIAGLPAEAREPALRHAEHVYRETLDQAGATAEQRDGWVKLQMALMRDIVKKIEAGGAPQGGNA
jgi:hypothetical protein